MLGDIEIAQKLLEATTDVKAEEVTCELVCRAAE